MVNEKKSFTILFFNIAFIYLLKNKNMNNTEITQAFLNNAKNTILTKTILYDKILEKFKSMKIQGKLNYFTTNIQNLSWEWNSFLRRSCNKEKIYREHLTPLNENFFVQNYRYKQILLFSKNNTEIIPLVFNRDGDIQELDVRRNNIKLFVEAYKKYVVNGRNPLEKLRHEKNISNDIVNSFGTFKYNVNILKNGRIRFDETKQLVETKDSISFSSNAVIISPECRTVNTYKNTNNFWRRNSSFSELDNLLGETILSTNNKDEFVEILKKTMFVETEKSLSNITTTLF